MNLALRALAFNPFIELVQSAHDIVIDKTRYDASGFNNEIGKRICEAGYEDHLSKRSLYVCVLERDEPLNHRIESYTLGDRKAYVLLPPDPYFFTWQFIFHRIICINYTPMFFEQSWVYMRIRFYTDRVFLFFYDLRGDVIHRLLVTPSFYITGDVTIDEVWPQTRDR